MDADELEASARDVRRWPDVIAGDLDGAAAYAFVRAAARWLPGLVDGLGAPALDPLLERDGFVAAWRRDAGDGDREVRRALGFRLALLGAIDAREVDTATASAVASDLVAADWRHAHTPELAAALAAAARVYATTWRAALSVAIRAAGAPVAAELVRAALPAPPPLPPDELAALALCADDPGAVLAAAAVTDDATWLAFERRALALTGDPALVARARLAAFVALGREGRPADAALVEPAALAFTGEWPEERSVVVVAALAALAPDRRAALLAETAPFPWRYAGCDSPASPRVLDAAVAALASADTPAASAWAIRAFAAWGDAGRAALAASALPIAQTIAGAIAAHAAHRPRDRAALAVAPALRAALDRALDALDADPAACPSRRVQLPVLAFGEPATDQLAPPTASWASAAVWVTSGFVPMIVAQLRAIPRHPPATPSPDAGAGAARIARLAHLLVALTRAVLPSWDALHPGDARPQRVVADAERVLAGAAPAELAARAELHALGYAATAAPGARAVARLAVWAHSAALDDGCNDVQDTPPDLAVVAATALAPDGANRVVRARALWERFLLELIPAVA